MGLCLGAVSLSLGWTDRELFRTFDSAGPEAQPCQRDEKSKRTRGFVPVILLALLACAPTLHGQVLTPLGTNSFEIFPDISLAPYTQSASSFTINGSFGLGVGTVGGGFVSGGSPVTHDWSEVGVFGLTLSVAGANPGLSFSVELFRLVGEEAQSVGLFNGTTAGLTNVPTVVVLEEVSRGDLSEVAGLQFTFDGAGTINATIQDISGLLSTAYVAWAGGYGLNPLVATGPAAGAPAADPDGDGFSNGLEFAFGTNPTQGNPPLTSPDASGGNFTLTWLQRGGVSYAVQSTTNLATTAFTNDGAVTVVDGPVLPAPPVGYVRKQFTVTASDSKFYRVRAVALP